MRPAVALAQASTLDEGGLPQSPDEPTRPRTARPLRAAILLLGAGVLALGSAAVTLVLAGGAPVRVVPGLPDAGLLVGWAVRVDRLLVDLLALMTVGALLVAAVLLPDRRPTPSSERAVRAAGRWACAWACSAALGVVLTVSDTAGVPPDRLTVELITTLGTTGQGGALSVVAVLATVVALASRRAVHARESRVLLLVALAAMLPTALNGHASSAADQDLATTGLVVHVVAAALWVGGLSGILVHLRDERSLLTVAVRRFSVLALGALTALAVSGLLTASTRLGLSLDLWTSGYGAVVAAKALALGVLASLGHLHRRRTIRLLGEGRRRPFLRWAAVELLVMAAAMGLAVALSRTPVPALPVVADPSHGLGHSTLPSAVAPISLAELATHWRLNAVVLLVLGLALAAYATGVGVLARRGVRWSGARTTSFVVGLLLALVSTCSGVATYAPALVSVQLVQLVTVLLGVPLLVALSAPLTLLTQVQGREGAGSALLATSGARRVSNPACGATMVCLLLLGLYRTPLIELSLRSFWVHLLVVALALLSGLLLMWPLVGVDPTPQAGSPGERMVCMSAVVGCLLLLAAQLRFGERLLAGRWFLELRWGWVDPVADQRLGGLVVAAVALVTLLVTAVAAHRGHIRSRTRPNRSSPGIAP